MMRALACLCAVLQLLAAGAAAAESRIPAYLLQVPDDTRHLFVADAGTATLYHYARTDERLQLVETSYMSIGQKGAGKEREWDRRTPLGIYFVTERLDTSRMHPKYGVMAFPLDYPNILDRLQERSGNGIWVHGVLPGAVRRPEFDTDGCIALPNEDLARMQAAFVPEATPVIVTRGMRWGNDEDRARIVRELREQLASWTQAAAADDAAAYLALYAPDFRYRGLSREDWAAFRSAAARDRGAALVAVDDVLLLADPEQPGVYLSRFRQRTSAAGTEFETLKRLYWQRGPDGVLRIIAEDNG